MNTDKSEKKVIRFIDRRGNELFTILDGEKITVLYANGKQIDFRCKYIDEANIRIGMTKTAISTIDKKMKKIGAIYYPARSVKQSEPLQVEAQEQDDDMER